MIRNGNIHDSKQILPLAIEALERDAYENLLISPDKIKAMILEIVSSKRHFGMVSVDEEGNIQGVVAAVVNDLAFYERKQASVVMYYCKRPGDGIKMLRKLMRWIEARPIIRLVEFTMEACTDPRVPKLLKRLGLVNESLPTYVYIK